MTPRARRSVALAVVTATLAALRLLVPDPAARRECMLFVMVPLGYGHVLGAVCIGGSRARRVRDFLASAIGILIALSMGGDAAGVVVALAAFAVWHVLENESAAREGRLPPVSRSPGLHLALLLATAAVIGAALATPWLTRPALELGIPVGFAAWTAEELLAAVLYYHVVVWGLRAASGRRTPAVLVVHALPLGLAAAGALLWPTAHAIATDPLPYLIVSVAHALHTGWERGLAPRA